MTTKVTCGECRMRRTCSRESSLAVEIHSGDDQPPRRRTPAGRPRSTCRPCDGSRRRLRPHSSSWWSTGGSWAALTWSGQPTGTGMTVPRLQLPRSPVAIAIKTILQDLLFVRNCFTGPPLPRDRYRIAQKNSHVLWQGKDWTPNLGTIPPGKLRSVIHS